MTAWHAALLAQAVATAEKQLPVLEWQARYARQKVAYPCA